MTRKSKKFTRAPAMPQGYLRQADAARYCSVSRDTIHRADKLFRRSGGRFGLKGERKGRMQLYAIDDVVKWIEAGMPTGVHRQPDGTIGMVIDFALN